MKTYTAHVGLALAGLTANLPTVHAFVRGGLSLSLANGRAHAPFLIYSSLDDDEISKLIGKRDKIRRKTKEELPKEEEFLDIVPLDLEDMEKMPEFKTKRTKRTTKKDEEDEKAKKTSSSNEVFFVDYYSDYDDENDFHIPNRMGVSTRCWGDVNEGFVSSGKKLKKQQLREGKFVAGDIQLAYNNLMNEGILLFETSPEYGAENASKKLTAEHILARCTKEYDEADVGPLLVDTYANKIWQRGANGLTASLNGSCEKLEVSSLEILQVKNTGWLPTGGLVKGMVEGVVDQGTTNYVGVQNVAPIRLRRISSKLDSQGIALTTNSFEFSLTNRKKEKWINSCKALGVIPLITNPLGSGLASGQYTASNPSGGVAGAAKFSFNTLDKLQPLHSVLETVAEKVKTRVKKQLQDVNERSRRSRGPGVSTLGYFFRILD
jgi:aryl-alcohol dehydrogenase-like predicted oxidoreductase